MLIAYQLDINEDQNVYILSALDSIVFVISVHILVSHVFNSSVKHFINHVAAFCQVVSS